MAQTIRIKRGIEADRVGNLAGLPLGEIIYTTTNHEIFLGDGSTAGGVALGYITTRDQGSAQTISGDLNIDGNLVVTGDVTQTSTTNVNIGDAVITLAKDNIDNPIDNAGIEIYRGTLDDAVSILWNETENYWQLTDAGDAGTDSDTRRILDSNDIVTSPGVETGISITLAAPGTPPVITNTDLGSSQLFYKTVTGNSGTTSASENEDSISIVGAGSVTTAVTADTVTITGTTYTADETQLTLNGTVFEHKTGTGHFHISDDGIDNDGKVLTGSATPGVFTWESAGAATNDAHINLHGSGVLTFTSSLDNENGFFTTNQNTDETFTIAHDNGDGNMHVSSVNNAALDDGKVLTAGATSGTFAWAAPVQVSTDVTLATVTSNYLTLSGQEITSGVVPVTLGGTGAITAADARTNLGVDEPGTDNSTNVTLNTGIANYLSIPGDGSQVITLLKLDIEDDTNLSVDTSLTLAGNDLSVAIVDGGDF